MSTPPPDALTRPADRSEREPRIAPGTFRETGKTLPAIEIVAGLEQCPEWEALRKLLPSHVADALNLAPEITPPCPSRMLRLETASGLPLNHPDVIAAHWQQPPFAMGIRLALYLPESAEPEILDTAVVGTRSTRASLTIRLERAGLLLLRDALLGFSRDPGGRLPSHPLGRPGLARQARGWMRHFGELYRNRLMSEWWSLGTTSVPLSRIVGSGALGDVAWLEPQCGRNYLADPFPWPGTGRVLAEEMAANDVGRIVMLEPDASGSFRRAGVILEDGHHHSYPCTFQEEGTTYLLPETPVHGCTALYRLGPDGFLEKLCDVAPERRLGDPTLFRHDGRYWIACIDLDIGLHDNLCFYHAESLAGPWRPHRLWPVKLDIRSARPAGSLFRIGGALFRPAQDCARSYGAGVTINRVDELTPFRFRETAVAILRPDPDGAFPDGLHTFTPGEELAWVDGKRYVFDAKAAAGKVGRRLMRVPIRLLRGSQ
jgi:hypothetical protein